ncbi:sigma-70 family RNA polymerase sigma factor [bacterium]|nr:sigma-70 family RNA polymerase sigma factor [bacterium]
MKLTDFFKSPKSDPVEANCDSPALEARFAAGEMTAMEEIMAAHKQGLYRMGFRLFANRERADDFFQDVFIRIYEKRKHYDPSRPLKPWLYQVAMNLGRDQLRRKGEIIMDANDLPEQPHDPQAEKQLLKEEVKQKVWSVIGSMGRTHREILALRFSSDLSHKEIANILNISLSAAKVRLCRGLRAFEDAFRAQGGERYVL